MYPQYTLPPTPQERLAWAGQVVEDLKGPDSYLQDKCPVRLGLPLLVPVTQPGEGAVVDLRQLQVRDGMSIEDLRQLQVRWHAWGS